MCRGVQSIDYRTFLEMELLGDGFQCFEGLDSFNKDSNLGYIFS